MRKVTPVTPAPPIASPKQSIAPSIILFFAFVFLILITASYLLHPQKVSLFLETVVEDATALARVFFYSLMAVLVLALIAAVVILRLWAKDRVEKTRRIYPDDRGLFPAIQQNGEVLDVNAMDVAVYKFGRKGTGPVLEGLSYEDKIAQREATMQRRAAQVMAALGSGGGSIHEVTAPLAPPARFAGLFSPAPRVRELGPGTEDPTGKELLTEIEGQWRVADDG